MAAMHSEAGSGTAAKPDDWPLTDDKTELTGVTPYGPVPPEEIVAGTVGSGGAIHHQGATGTEFEIRRTTSPGDTDTGIVTSPARRLDPVICQLADTLLASGRTESATTRTGSCTVGSPGEGPSGSSVRGGGGDFMIMSSGLMTEYNSLEK